MKTKTFRVRWAGFLTLFFLGGCSTCFLVPQKAFYKTVNVALWSPTKFEDLEITRPLESEIADFTEKILAPEMKKIQGFRVIQDVDDAKNADCIMFINYKRGVRVYKSSPMSSGATFGNVSFSVSSQSSQHIPTLAIYMKIKEKDTDVVLYYKEMNICDIAKYSVEEIFKKEKFKRKWEKILSRDVLGDFVPIPQDRLNQF